MNTTYCSPAKADNIQLNNSCFDKQALIRIIDAFNKRYPEQAIVINNIKKKSFKALHKELYNRFQKICKNDETCWVEKLGLGDDAIVNDYFRPRSPRSWHLNPREWLDENNINDVLRQYEKAVAPQYKYYGTQPSDFLRKDVDNTCHNKHLCSINIEKLYESGVRMIGMVINLDPHYMSGSHWTSLFACICPLKPCFGVYFYDSSITNKVPNDVLIFMDIIEKQCLALKDKLKSNRVFKKKCNTKRHQYGRTECGVFSLYNQIKWLELYSKTDGHATFNEVFNSNITDELMEQLRKLLFRPI